MTGASIADDLAEAGGDPDWPTWLVIATAKVIHGLERRLAFEAFADERDDTTSDPHKKVRKA